MSEHTDLDATRSMGEADQQAFLARFTGTGRSVDFAMLGGSFGEGVHLTGTRLIGVFIATLGLPQINPVNQQMKARMDEEFDAGYAYKYLLPGLRKVVQAGGASFADKRIASAFSHRQPLCAPQSA